MSNKNISDGVKRINSAEYPSNSNKSREVAETTEKKITKVISGTVMKKKKSLLKKFTEVFVGDDVGSVTSYVLYDVLIPAAKSTLWEMVSSGFDMLLFGEVRSRNNTKFGPGKAFVNYGNFSNKQDTRRPADPRSSSNNRNQKSVDELIFETKADAQEVLYQLAFLTEEYGQATLADLYDLVGQTGDFTDVKYGWITVNEATVVRARNGGFMINLPRALPLD